ncbi:hypothetical protein EYF80_038079 [Liparis tanakae]|uniref:Uncharacterized protein n=1 Tax=Liparis tanakae TaxID=230148 RepID=A0A4Z2GED5_9TELE|nr:hypothetical protein EYF80_038079 [Liparis tanakae]
MPALLCITLRKYKQQPPMKRGSGFLDTHALSLKEAQKRFTTEWMMQRQEVAIFRRLVLHRCLLLLLLLIPDSHV